ncbi:TPA: hypothetical protein QD004_004212 [Shewanella algae]|nr:hypothetical protein [Shewanella algae]
MEVTGAPRHTEYVVKTDLMKSGEIKFDGFNPERGVLIDAKDFNKWPKDEAWSLDVVLRDARKQSAVASQVKTKVEWHIPNQEKFDLVSQLLRENKVKHIKLIYTPKGGQ